ncbi:MAG TPA: adenosylcobinamide-phosphate synthase CbiB [Methyloceanibacter sp.]|nr:adenosylcobinamide-phosphate synthase CbiB [Methyloceanibacter sp.]
MAAPLALLALLIELVAGYPDWIAKSIGHPVTWMGRLITFLDTRLNRDGAEAESRRRAGAIALFLLLLIVGAIAFTVETVLLLLPFGLIFAGIASSAFIAQRSLYKHVADVADALDTGNLAKARKAVAHIVGRDTADLDEAGVARAAIESLSENFSDGVVSPVIWICLAGLTGGALYKAVNTADSMIGHRNARYENFGKPAAQLDDLVNLPGSRISALLIVAAAALGGGSASGAWQSMTRDAAKHASPNAGYPEAAMAGALGLSLGGPHTYDGVETDAAWLGDGRREANAADVQTALGVYGRADGLLIALVFTLATLTAIV